MGLQHACFVNHRQGCRQHPGSAVVVNVGLCNVQGRLAVLVGKCALNDEHIIGGEGSILTNCVFFQTQVVIVCTKLADGISVSQANTDGLAVTDQLNVVNAIGIVVGIPIAPGRIVDFRCGEVDTAGCCAMCAGLQHTHIIGNRLNRLGGGEFQRAVIVVDVSLADIHHAAGGRMLEAAFDDQIVLIHQRQNLACNRPGLCFQAIVGSCELNQGSLSGHTHTLCHIAANQLNHIGTNGCILDTPIILHEISIIFRCGGINNTGGPAVAAALQGANGCYTIVELCFQVVAVHCLHQCLQLCGAACIVVFSDDVVQGAVGNRQRAVIDAQCNIVCQFLRIDIAHFNVVHSVLLLRCTLAEGKVCNIFGRLKVETYRDLVAEHQGDTVQADACQVVFQRNGGHLCGNFLRSFQLIAGICKITRIIIEVGLRCCTVIQGLQNHILHIIRIIAIQNILGILTNRIFTGMHRFFSVFHSQNDGVVHLCRCNVYRYKIIGDHRGNRLTVHGGGHGVVCAVQTEIHTDVVAQCNIPAFQHTCCIAGGEHSCRQH